jgi:lipopolysaccharide transport system permease protein
LAHFSTRDRVTVYEPPSLARLAPLTALSRLRQSGDLLLALSVHRVKVRYKQSRLGILWAVVQPVAMMLAFTLMFAFLRTAPSGDIPFPLFAYAALIPWTTFSTGLTNATTALTSHAGLLTKVCFPREILPLTYVAAALVDMSIASVVLAGLLVWYHVPLTMHALWVVPTMLVLAGVMIGLGLLFSAVQVRYRDVGLAMPVLVQVWLFATPVLYPLTSVKSALPPALYTVYVLNPMAGVVDGFRRALVLRTTPDLHALTVAGIVVALLVPIAYSYFKYAESTMADRV